MNSEKFIRHKIYNYLYNLKNLIKKNDNKFLFLIKALNEYNVNNL